MSGIETSVAGVDRFASTVEAAGRDLVNLDQVDHDAGDLVIAAADIPYRTGALAKTVRARIFAGGVDVVAGGPGVDYAAAVHARNPFLTKAIAAAEDAIAIRYADHAERVVDTIQGA